MAHVHSAGVPQGSASPRPDGRHRLTPFWRHYLQMVGAMTVGMIATGAVFLSVTGARTWDEVTVDHPTAALLAMAVGMTAPMVLWMAHMGMSRRSTDEMAAAMVLPVVPCLLLVWSGITPSAQCGLYCVLMLVAMWAVMRHRRDEYSLEG